ncbi:hypothetical protein K461DRAFT_49057 [Myriangium duriaei CBS 260.36]|uniref:Ubiquitin 3 binding protein But2 C-terminal domain-containing protein n=1 Tax=Myriangium duriaei CBS 260.36 TaxID=1168546 RepID=A0A9P4MH33_9PEZI|nr:hypothetical protein K461DRAFT_49057 [Myriangium duriaei CBS 260.36]
MKSLISTTLAAILLPSTLTLAQTRTSSCPYNYPVDLNTTKSAEGLTFNVISNNPLTNNRVLQLRPNPYSTGAGNFSFVGIDAHSPVLLANFNSGKWVSQARNLENQIYDLGPTGYLNLRTTVNGTSQYTVGFADATVYPAAADEGWKLEAPNFTGTYGLYHAEGDGVANGFILCDASQGNADVNVKGFYQLFYYVYSETPAELKGCEFIGVRTTVAPDIENGACSIG